MTGLKIGELAGQTGTTAPTIRYYEEIGLLRRPQRQDGNQRRYGEDDVRRLTFIRRCRSFGFGIEQVRSLASLVENRFRSCKEARDLASERLVEVRIKLKELRQLEKKISAFIAACDADCAGGPGPDCAILEDLGNPSASQHLL